MASRSGQPAASRRRLEAEERKGEILDAAFEEFSLRGYAGARLEDVAVRAGVAKGLPHFYFKRKSDLFCAVLRRIIIPTWTDLAESATASDAPTREVLSSTLREMYRRLAANKKAQEVMRLLIAEGPRFPELVELYYHEVLKRKIAIWTQIVKRGIQRGEFRETPLVKHAQIIHGPVFMAAIWQALWGKNHGLDLDAWIESHLDLVLHGLERKGGRTKR